MSPDSSEKKAAVAALRLCGVEATPSRVAWLLQKGLGEHGKGDDAS